MSTIKQEDLDDAKVDAVKLTELVGAALARFWEGGARLVDYPNDDSLEYNLNELNYRAWRLRWRLGVNDLTELEAEEAKARRTAEAAE